MITYDKLRLFAYSNDRLINGEIRGLVVDFQGLGFNGIIEEDTENGRFYAERGLIYAIPYVDPWAWMNRVAVLTTDSIIGALEERYGKELPVCSTGGSMGGQEALIFCLCSSKNVVSCVANCPVCDMVFHITERDDLPRTMLAAFGGAEDFDVELRLRSPYHVADRLPKIPYTVFHCEEDRAVNIDAHSSKFVERMRELGHDVTFVRVPGRGHCDLGDASEKLFAEAVLSSFR